MFDQKSITPEEERQVRAAVRTIIRSSGAVVDRLTRSAIRAQGAGTDRRLAEFLGYDLDQIRDDDWADVLDNEECDRIFEEQLAGSEVAPHEDVAV